MRQAGRSLPEYREIRERYTLFEICRQRELCAEVTLQPVHRHRVDAAVSSPTSCSRSSAWESTSTSSTASGRSCGPDRELNDVERLRVPEPEEAVPFLLEAVRLVRDELDDDQAVIGFAGGPVHGRQLSHRGQADARLREDEEPACTARPRSGTPLHGTLADTFARLPARARWVPARDAVQLFDSWVGALSADDYREFVAPYSARVLARRGGADDPLRHRDDAPAPRR